MTIERLKLIKEEEEICLTENTEKSKIIKELINVNIKYEKIIGSKDYEGVFQLKYVDITGLIEVEDNEVYIFILKRYENEKYRMTVSGSLKNLEEMTIDEKNRKLYFMNVVKRSIANLNLGNKVYDFYTAIKFYKKLEKKVKEY